MADVMISYIGSKIASMEGSGVKTILTSGKYCEDDIYVSYSKKGNATAKGDSSISINNAESGYACSLIQYGVCEQDDQTNAISCNNGTLSISSGEIVITAENRESITLGSQTATVENLYSVGNVRDEHELVTGTVIRKNAACIYDGTQPVGDRYISSTGAKDNGAIIIYPLETEYTGNSIVSFTETVKQDVNLLEARIELSQDLHGYSNPWPGGGGVNILPMTNWFQAGYTSTYNGVTMTVNADGSITLSGTANPQADFYLSRTTNGITLNPFYVDAGTYTISMTGTQTISGVKLVMSGSGQNGYPYSEAPSNGAAKTGAVTDATQPFNYFLLRITSGTVSDGTYYIQFESGSTATSWAPYENICPISGLTGLSVYDDPKYGEMIVWNQIFRTGINGSSNGLTFLHDDAWTTYTVTGTSTATVYRQLDMASTTVGHVYFVDKGIDNTDIQLYNDSAGVTTTTSSQYGIGKATASKKLYLWFRNGSTFDLTIKPMICDLTIMFGSAKADEIYAMEQAEAGSGVSYFKTLFTKEYYSYNAGETTNVSAVDGTIYWKETVDWTAQAGTVYHGTPDVVTGVLTVNYASVDLGTLTWSKSSGKFTALLSNPKSSITGICSNYKESAPGTQEDFSWTILSMSGGQRYIVIKDSLRTSLSVSDFKTYISGAQFVYEIATPLTYQLAPQEIKTLVGQNNIFSPDATSIKVAVSNPRIEQVIPQPLTLAEGDNTIIATNLSVSSVPLKLEYDREISVYAGAHHSVVTVVITFMIDGITYSADSGMTWTQWCASAYNTDGFVCSNGYVLDSTEMMAIEYNASYASTSQTIVENSSYITTPYVLM